MMRQERYSSATPAAERIPNPTSIAASMEKDVGMRSRMLQAAEQLKRIFSEPDSTSSPERMYLAERAAEAKYSAKKAALLGKMRGLILAMNLAGGVDVAAAPILNQPMGAAEMLEIIKTGVTDPEVDLSGKKKTRKKSDTQVSV